MNGLGQLQIAIPSPDSLSAAPIGVLFLSDAKEDKVFNMQPAQRVLHTLGNLQTGDALKNARTSDNKPLFSDSIKQKHGDNFSQVADILAKVPEMVASIESSTGSGHTPHAKDEITIAW